MKKEKILSCITVIEITFEANQTFGLTASKISQTKLKMAKNLFLTIVLVVIKKSITYHTNQVSNNLYDRFSNQSDQSNFSLPLSDRLGVFRTLYFTQLISVG